LREGEEKWEAYARVVRSIMQRVLDIPLCEVSIEEKFDFKKLIFGSKAKHGE